MQLRLSHQCAVVVDHECHQIEMGFLQQVGELRWCHEILVQHLHPISSSWQLRGWPRSWVLVEQQEQRAEREVVVERGLG
jgi:hypothetical protein